MSNKTYVECIRKLQFKSIPNKTRTAFYFMLYPMYKLHCTQIPKKSNMLGLSLVGTMQKRLQNVSRSIFTYSDVLLAQSKSLLSRRDYANRIG